jgi:hypothetical protein
MASDAANREAAGFARGVLRRGWAAAEWITRNDLTLASLVLGVLIVIFFYDVVFLGRTLLTSPLHFHPGAYGYAPTDSQPDHNPYLLDPLASAAGAEPTFKKAARIISHLHGLPWNANLSLGRPFLAEATSANFSPIRLPLMIWPSPEMWDAFLLARLFVAGLFTYLLAKRLGLAKPAAFGATVAFAFSGYFMLYVNMEHPDIYITMPVLLYAFDLLLERPGPGRMAFAVVAVALGVLAFNPQPAVVLLLYGAGYYLARAFVVFRDGGDFRPWPRILPLGLALGLGVGLTAFKLVPFLELSGSLGFGGLGTHGHTGRGLGFDHLRFLVSLFVPYFDGAPLSNYQGTGWTGIRNYVGVVVPLLAFIGLWNRPAMRKGGWFFLVAAVIVLAKIYGVPVVQWLGRLPVLKYIDYGLYASPLVTFSMAMLSGIGLDQLARSGWRWWHLPLAVAAFALLLGWLVWLNRGILDTVPTNHLVLHLTFASCLIVASAAMIAATRWRLVTVHTGIALLIGLMVVELFTFTTPTKGEFADLADVVYGRTDVTIIDRPQRHETFVEAPYISFLKEDTSKYRVIGLDGVLYPNATEAYDLDDIRGLTAISVERYVKYVREFIDPSVVFQWRGGDWPPMDTKGGPLLLGSNPMFDLLNVKYVVTTEAFPLAYTYELAAQFLPAVPETGSSGRLTVFDVDGEKEAVLFEHPPNSLSYSFTPSEESRFLLFKLALDPQVWEPAKGDGVLFKVSAQGDEGNEVLFSKWVDPKNNPDDRRWIDGVVDLEAFIGRPLTLLLSTSPGETPIWDWAGWGGLRLAPSPDTTIDESSSSQFELAYDGEVQIYQNRNALSRAFVVHRAVLAPEESAAVALMRQPDFAPSAEAVVEGSVPESQMAALASSPAADGSSVEITNYSDNQVKLVSHMDNPGLLVLSDAYYPGWKAYVDGKQTPIYATDVALRSVFLPAGEHSVEFTYSPASFKLGAAVSIASLAALMLYVIWRPLRIAAERSLRRRGESR